MKIMVLKCCFDCPHNKGKWCGLKHRDVEVNVSLEFPSWCPLEEVKDDTGE
jgi:hypothetical protein